MENVEIIILTDENEITGIKVNDCLFLKREKESVVDFFNQKVIPYLFKEKQIDLANYYKDENITVIEENDYNNQNTDNLIITEKEKGEILISLNYDELEYNQKLYINKEYKKITNELFNYDKKDENLETVKNRLAEEIIEKIDKTDNKNSILLSYFEDYNVALILEHIKYEKSSDERINQTALMKGVEAVKQMRKSYAKSI